MPINLLRPPYIAMLCMLASATAAAAQDLRVFADGVASVPGVQSSRYFNVQNAGPGPFWMGGNFRPHLRVFIDLPGGPTSVTAGGAGWSCPSAPFGTGSRVTCRRIQESGALPVNQSFPTITVSAVGTRVGQHDVCARVQTQGTDPNPNNNQACKTWSVVESPFVCLMNGSAPKIMSGLGSATIGPDVAALPAAQNNAKGDWRSKVLLNVGGGLFYQDVALAKMQDMACTTANNIVSCTFTAQPCARATP
ncbi:hypothetical protein [Phenylobacterium sp.]|uniref:hypothetical protein n=1 Tax=Phenylobacterium sp. TaxID=1871053 RepID=UPI002736259E|nr:hypothetical protein [Phenylobacterium sp.]MDP3634209.1 hypothetical protein [Phenylobacterium sp.]